MPSATPEFDGVRDAVAFTWWMEEAIREKSSPRFLRFLGVEQVCEALSGVS